MAGRGREGSLIASRSDGASIDSGHHSRCSCFPCLSGAPRHFHVLRLFFHVLPFQNTCNIKKKDFAIIQSNIMVALDFYIQAANLRGFCASVNPRFEGGILDFMENLNKF